MRATAALLVLLGWLAVLRGLYLLPPSTRPELDLEAGPAFGVTVEVYRPAMAIAAFLIVLLPVGVIARRLGPAAVVAAASVSGAFGLWVLTRNELLDYRPGLSGHLWVGAALSATALVVACAAAMASRDASPGLGSVSAPPP